MELKEFVKETLVQIVKGVSDANSELSDTTSFVPSVNRVRFTIPLALPTEPEDKLYTKK